MSLDSYVNVDPVTGVVSGVKSASQMRSEELARVESMRYYTAQQPTYTLPSSGGGTLDTPPPSALVEPPIFPPQPFGG